MPTTKLIVYPVTDGFEVATWAKFSLFEYSDPTAIKLDMSPIRSTAQKAGRR